MHISSTITTISIIIINDRIDFESFKQTKPKSKLIKDNDDVVVCLLVVVFSTNYFVRILSVLYLDKFLIYNWSTVISNLNLIVLFFWKRRNFFAYQKLFLCVSWLVFDGFKSTPNTHTHTHTNKQKNFSGIQNDSIHLIDWLIEWIWRKWNSSSSTVVIKS